jgi:hypothetical protein
MSFGPQQGPLGIEFIGLGDKERDRVLRGGAQLGQCRAGGFSQQQKRE